MQRDGPEELTNVEYVLIVVLVVVVVVVVLVVVVVEAMVVVVIVEVVVVMIGFTKEKIKLRMNSRIVCNGEGAQHFHCRPSLLSKCKKNV